MKDVGWLVHNNGNWHAFFLELELRAEGFSICGLVRDTTSVLLPEPGAGKVCGLCAKKVAKFFKIEEKKQINAPFARPVKVVEGYSGCYLESARGVVIASNLAKSDAEFIALLINKYRAKERV